MLISHFNHSRKNPPWESKSGFEVIQLGKDPDLDDRIEGRLIDARTRRETCETTHQIDADNKIKTMISHAPSMSGICPVFYWTSCPPMMCNISRNDRCLHPAHLRAPTASKRRGYWHAFWVCCKSITKMKMKRMARAARAVSSAIDAMPSSNSKPTRVLIAKVILQDNLSQKLSCLTHGVQSTYVFLICGTLKSVPAFQAPRGDS
jgi:hypothetical protein